MRFLTGAKIFGSVAGIALVGALGYGIYKKIQDISLPKFPTLNIADKLADMAQAAQLAHDEMVSIAEHTDIIPEVMQVADIPVVKAFIDVPSQQSLEDSGHELAVALWNVENPTTYEAVKENADQATLSDLELAKAIANDTSYSLSARKLSAMESADLENQMISEYFKANPLASVALYDTKDVIAETVDATSEIVATAINPVGTVLTSLKEGSTLPQAVSAAVAPIITVAKSLLSNLRLARNIEL